MVKKEVLIIFGMLFLVGVVSAITTPIQVKTLPWHEVQITAFDSDNSGFVSLDKIILTSDRYGDVYWNASVTKNFNLMVYIKKRGESITSNKFLEEYEPGKEIYVEVAPSGAQLIETPEQINVEIIEEINETISNETIEAEIVEDKKSFFIFTAKAIFGEGGVLSNKMIYYVSGGIVGLIVIIFIILKMVKKGKNSDSPKEIKITKLSEFKAQQESDALKNEELMRAEEELKEAQAKIAAIKNKDRIAQLEKEIEEKQKQLQELGGKKLQKIIPEKISNESQLAWKPERKEE